MQDIDWGNIRLLIFDVDGTLYDQQRLRRRMALALVFHYIVRPRKLPELYILRTFRKERERNRDMKVDNLEEAQYEWCRIKTGASRDRIMALVSFWMHEFPLKYLPGCVFPGVQELFSGAGKLQVPVAVLSDYPSDQKLQSMGLKADLVVSATQPEVNSLKPDPKGLLYIADNFNLRTQDCLYIEDRPDLDLEAARSAGMNFLLADRKQIRETDFFTQILNRLDRQGKNK